MKNALISIGVMLLVVAGIRLIAKGASYEYAENKVSKGETYQEARSFRAEVLEGCLTEGGEKNRAYCQCAVDYMQSHYGDARLQAIALEYVKTNQTPPEMQEAVDACIDKYVL